MEQFSLDLFDTDNPHAHLWEGLAEPQQAVVLETDPGRARAIGRPRVNPYLGLTNYLSSLRRLAKAVQGDAQRAEGPSDE